MKPSKRVTSNSEDSKTTQTNNKRRSLLLEIVRTYFQGLAKNDVSMVPWAENATLRVPINPHGGAAIPITGRIMIVASFSNPMLPGVEKVEVIRHVVEGQRVCTRVDFLLKGVPTELRAIIWFRIERGKIVEQEHFYDPRPALQNGNEMNSTKSDQWLADDSKVARPANTPA